MKKYLTLFLAMILLVVATLSSTTVSYAKYKDAQKTKYDLYKMVSEKNFIKNSSLNAKGIYRFTKTDKVDKKTYSTTTVDVFSSDPNFLNIVGKVSATPTILYQSGSNYKDKYDDAMSNMAYSTVNYEETTINGNSYCKVTNVSGGYQNLDRTCKVISQELQFGQSSDSTVYFTIKTPTSTYWSYSAPSSWQQVRTNAVTTMQIGARYILTIQRNSSPWKVELENFVYQQSGSIWP